MREVVALAGAYLREAGRGRGVRTMGVLGTLLLIALLAALPDAAARTTLAAGLLLVVGISALGAGLRAAAFLPEDREAGRAAWLATLAPPAWRRRLAPAGVGVVAALLVGALGGLLVGLGVQALAPGEGVRPSQGIEGLRGALVGVDAAHALRVAIPGTRAEVVEIGLRHRFVRWEDVGAAPSRLVWRFEGADDGADAAGATALARGAPLRVAVPPGARVLRLHHERADRTLVVTDARALGPSRSPVGSYLFAGLLLGVLAASVTPAAVFLSRWTSAATASGAAAVLVLAGGLRALLGDLSGPAASPWASMGQAVVGVAARLGPDVRVLTAVGAPVHGRVLDPGGLGVVLPLLLYAAVGLVLVASPLPDRAAEEVS